MNEQTFESAKSSLDAWAIILQSVVRDDMTLCFRIFPTTSACNEVLPSSPFLISLSLRRYHSPISTQLPTTLSTTLTATLPDDRRFHRQFGEPTSSPFIDPGNITEIRSRRLTTRRTPKTPLLSTRALTGVNLSVPGR